MAFKMKYMVLDFHPLVFFYALGMTLVPLGVLLGLYIGATRLFFGWAVSPNFLILDALLLITGIQFTLFAMLFDMQESDKRIQNGEIEAQNGNWN